MRSKIPGRKNTNSIMERTVLHFFMLLTSTGSHKETSGCFVKLFYSNYCTLRNIVENDETLSESNEGDIPSASYKMGNPDISCFLMISSACTDEYIPTSVREIAEVHVGGSILGYCGYNILISNLTLIGSCLPTTGSWNGGDIRKIRISISTYTMWASTPPQIYPDLLQLFNVHLLGNDVSSYDDDIIPAVNTWHRVYVESSIYIFS
ncbi:uncharacterized protein EV154DRAFT_482165 [Mucor mucedo]|uniref:uncharacterized protein n=1 Tax=Mucor mucedo TaxID=29922 RepID=UPI00221F7597|nr:uncharacterized protein EV154DRAFT_482165 [Mucor mucedo]KAI7890441.1 hypothetical protein EV154DRAFT_482165 [Mucor mucedo]